MKLFSNASALPGLVTPPLPAAVWQWSVPDGNASAYLWIPDNCEHVTGMVVDNHHS